MINHILLNILYTYTIILCKNLNFGGICIHMVYEMLSLFCLVCFEVIMNQLMSDTMIDMARILIVFIF